MPSHLTSSKGTPRSELSQAIYEGRLRRNWTQDRLAQELGLKSSEYIGMIENGHRQLSLDRIPTLARALELNETEFTWLALKQYFPEAHKVLVDRSDRLGREVSSERERIEGGMDPDLFALMVDLDEQSEKLCQQLASRVRRRASLTRMIKTQT